MPHEQTILPTYGTHPSTADQHRLTFSQAEHGSGVWGWEITRPYSLASIPFPCPLSISVYMLLSFSSISSVICGLLVGECACKEDVDGTVVSVYCPVRLLLASLCVWDGDGHGRLTPWSLLACLLRAIHGDMVWRLGRACSRRRFVLVPL